MEALRPGSVPVPARASAIVTLLGSYQRVSDDAAFRSFAEASRDFLFSHAAGAALNDLYGQDQTGKFLSSLENMFNTNPSGAALRATPTLRPASRD